MSEKREPSVNNHTPINQTDRNLSEVFVESVAYMVASYFRTRQFNVYF